MRVLDGRGGHVEQTLHISHTSMSPPHPYLDHLGLAHVAAAAKRAPDRGREAVEAATYASLHTVTSKAQCDGTATWEPDVAEDADAMSRSERADPTTGGGCVMPRARVGERRSSMLVGRKRDSAACLSNDESSTCDPP